MRDVRFKAVHRGGEFDPHRHHLLVAWAADGAEHVLPLFCAQYPHDDRPSRAIEIAQAQSRGEATVGQARAAAFAAGRPYAVKAVQAVAAFDNVMAAEGECGLQRMRLSAEIRIFKRSVDQ